MRMECGRSWRGPGNRSAAEDALILTMKSMIGADVGAILVVAHDVVALTAMTSMHDIE